MSSVKSLFSLEGVWKVTVLSFLLNGSMCVASDVAAQDPLSTHKILTYNLCAVKSLCEGRPDLRIRLSKSIQQITKINPDIVCLQEASQKEANFVCKELMNQGYAVISTPVNGSEKVQRLITAYKEDRFYGDNPKRWWYHPGNPEQCRGNQWYKWGHMMTAITLYRLTSESMPDYDAPEIVVCNTHLGHKRGEKTFSIQLALDLLKKHYGDGPVVFCGDYNFFDDDGGSYHRSLFTRAGYTDLAEHLTDTEGSRLSGTYVGYSSQNDEFLPKNRDMLSRLDGIFARGVIGRPAQCAVAVELTHNLENRDQLPSDHLPVFAEIAY